MQLRRNAQNPPVRRIHSLESSTQTSSVPSKLNVTNSGNYNLRSSKTLRPYNSMPGVLSAFQLPIRNPVEIIMRGRQEAHVFAGRAVQELKLYPNLIENMPNHEDSTISNCKTKQNQIDKVTTIPITVGALNAIQSNAPEATLVEQWVQQHHADLQPTARLLAESFISISPEEFRRAIQNLATQFNTRTQSLTNTDLYPYIAIASRHKSSSMVLGMALEHIDCMPERIVNGDMLDTSSQTDIAPQAFLNHLATNEQIKRLVYFDDAIYSGSQIISLIQTLRNTMIHSQIKISVLEIYVPFITSYAASRIQEAIVSSKHPLKIIFFNHQSIPSLAEKISDLNEQENIKEMYQYENIESLSAAYMSHRIPDARSTLNVVLEQGRVAGSSHKIPFVRQTLVPYHRDYITKLMGQMCNQAQPSQCMAFLQADTGCYLVKHPKSDEQVCILRQEQGKIQSVPLDKTWTPIFKLRVGDLVAVQPSSTTQPIDWLRFDGTCLQKQA